jgi:hypothetical protein
MFTENKILQISIKDETYSQSLSDSYSVANESFELEDYEYLSKLEQSLDKHQNEACNSEISGKNENTIHEHVESSKPLIKEQNIPPVPIPSPLPKISNIPAIPNIPGVPNVPQTPLLKNIPSIPLLNKIPSNLLPLSNNLLT